MPIHTTTSNPPLLQCGHCKQLAPDWEKAAKALKGIVAVGAVDCDVHKDIAGVLHALMRKREGRGRGRGL